MANVILRREAAIIGSLFFLAPFVTLLAPLTTVPALILLSAGCVAISIVHEQRAKELLRFDRGLAVFAVVTLYLVINTTWSLDPARGLSKALWFGLIVLMTYAAARAVRGWDPRQIRLAGIGFVTGLSVGLVFVLFEEATDQALTRLLFNWFPFARPDSLKRAVVHEGRIVKISYSELNRNVAVLLLMVWPALFCVGRLTQGTRRQLGIGALLAASSGAIMLSGHESSKIALVFGAITFAIAWLWPKFARQGLFAAWCLAFALIVPLAILAMQQNIHQAEWLPYSARSRITIWAYTAEKVPEAPIFGIGLTSTRVVNADRRAKSGPQVLADPLEPGGPGLVWSTSPHAHNEFLQTWYELGVVGVILLLTVGSVVLGYIGRLSPPVQPFILAQFVSFFAIAAFAWGMWQSWLMALMGLAALYAALAAIISSERASSLTDPQAKLVAPRSSALAADKGPA